MWTWGKFWLIHELINDEADAHFYVLKVDIIHVTS